MDITVRESYSQRLTDINSLYGLCELFETSSPNAASDNSNDTLISSNGENIIQNKSAECPKSSEITSTYCKSGRCKKIQSNVHH